MFSHFRQSKASSERLSARQSMEATGRFPEVIYCGLARWKACCELLYVKEPLVHGVTVCKTDDINIWAPVGRMGSRTGIHFRPIREVGWSIPDLLPWRYQCHICGIHSTAGLLGSKKIFTCFQNTFTSLVEICAKRFEVRVGLSSEQSISICKQSFCQSR